jgi:hypothetical protein
LYANTGHQRAERERRFTGSGSDLDQRGTSQLRSTHWTQLGGHLRGRSTLRPLRQRNRRSESQVRPPERSRRSTGAETDSAATTSAGREVVLGLKKSTRSRFSNRARDTTEIQTDMNTRVGVVRHAAADAPAT